MAIDTRLDILAALALAAPLAAEEWHHTAVDGLSGGGERFDGNEPVGMEIQRSDDGGGPVALLNGPLPGSASRYLDREATPGVEYIYWLDVVETDGTVSRFGPTEAVTISEPKIELTLSAYPNPADDTVTFRCDLPDDGRVELAVFDLAGRRVATLMDGELTAGRHEAVWACADVKPGVYLCRLETTGGNSTERLVVGR
ncbi:MAG: T9SS type A sorting domain-containing protein [bacterium]|nr:T9SS type A sorting domain-containing protein [bacterium]